MAGVIGDKGIAVIGNIGRAAKAQTAKPISIKRFMHTTP
jgi:stage V sporulation protein SpoVS